ncbi:NUDIX domain-containing protein [Acetivibrio cellulolyticus]|uniref:NUDIX domain-containing protein n=1 Tax=Acetivibrio cellulolyticus TaxID=35830 RepID=UPI0001E2F55A|nr:NUDIX domain-containing protein [Acetivibrio cellulolyticus]
MKLRNLTVVYIFDQNRILMMHRFASKVSNVPYWTGIGGHFEENELNDPQKCLLRELFEETGIEVNSIEKLNLKYIVLNNVGHEIQQQYVFFAQLKNKHVKLIDCTEGHAVWIDAAHVFGLHMSYTNTAILKHYFNIGLNSKKMYVGISEKDSTSVSIIPL